MSLTSACLSGKERRLRLGQLALDLRHVLAERVLVIIREHLAELRVVLALLRLGILCPRASLSAKACLSRDACLPLQARRTAHSTARAAQARRTAAREAAHRRTQQNLEDENAHAQQAAHGDAAHGAQCGYPLRLAHGRLRRRQLWGGKTQPRAHGLHCAAEADARNVGENLPESRSRQRGEAKRYAKGRVNGLAHCDHHLRNQLHVSGRLCMLAHEHRGLGRA